MNKLNGRTTISCSKFNYNRLRKYASGGESMNDALTRVLNNLQLDAIALDIVKGNEST